MRWHPILPPECSALPPTMPPPRLASRAGRPESLNAQYGTRSASKTLRKHIVPMPYEEELCSAPLGNASDFRREEGHSLSPASPSLILNESVQRAHAMGDARRRDDFVGERR
jgi:hypothetical protein